MSQSKENDKLKGKESWFWISTYPFFSSTLYISPTSFDLESENHIHTINIFDIDGNKINTANVQCKNQRIIVLELDMLVGASKIVSGMSHAQVQLESPKGYEHYLRLHNEKEARMYQKPLAFSNSSCRSFPIKISSQHLNLLMLTNVEDEDIELSIELCAGDEKVQRSILVKARESKLVTVEMEFASALSHAADISLQAYVVIDTKSSKKLYAQLLERVRENSVSESYQLVP